MKKKLIIVSNESDRKYATYLQQLISAFDDSDDKQGWNKGRLGRCGRWDEKHYRDNLNCLNSTNHILFIGDNESAREARSNMNVKFYAVGMSYRLAWRAGIYARGMTGASTRTTTANSR